METVFVAMSGGVDSAYAACLLKRAGYRVVGFTFDLLPKGLRDDANPKMCCSAAQTGRARRVADGLGIAHYVVNMRDEFDRFVIGRFIEEYRRGRTPNPCVLCNRHIKFASFLQKARAMGADRVATGHYAGLEETPSGISLRKGKDRAKDQSYFLYPIRQADLAFLMFPLASLTKDAVRAGAAPLRGMGPEVRESQDICFIPGNDYRRFLERFIPARPGPIVHVDGRRVGSHEGVHLFTVGQRRGINLPHHEALYVVEVRTEENVVVVGPRDLLLRRRLRADEVNMLDGRTAGEARARVRYRQREEACAYTVRDGLLEVTFHDPVSSIGPGQSVVLYEGETVLGGGTIRDVPASPGPSP